MPKNDTNNIYFNFSYYALKLLSYGLYNNPWSAISELVANGFDAGATNVKILIDMSNKAKSAIEIFDNGSGMSYADLEKKYVFLGWNKREDSQLNEFSKQQVMGRKGIGKLAALYLSKRYYLITKTKYDESAWCFDMNKYQNTEIPSLSRSSINDLKIISDTDWNFFNTGTMVKLENVDLRNIGEIKLESLKETLSNFFLEKIGCKIEIAIKEYANDKINFSPINKKIASKNFCALFCNDNSEIEQQLSDYVYLPSPFEEVSTKRREVLRLNQSNFVNQVDFVGTRDFIKDDKSKIEKSYTLKGWIGLHTSINQNDARRNDPRFLRNSLYSPTKLRIYVRNKLAISNFMDYLGNVQVFSNYIEGEISFDILDDNDLPDIATTNRQDFKKDDERILLLKELVNPIIKKLIDYRKLLASYVNNEEYLIKVALEEQIEREKQDKENAFKAQSEAIAKQQQAEEIATRERKRSEYILSVSKLDDKNLLNTVHDVYNLSVRVQKNLAKISNIENLPSECKKFLENATTSCQRIISISKMVTKAGVIFDKNDLRRSVDLTSFINEFIKKAGSKIYQTTEEKQINIRCVGDLNSTFDIEIKPLSFIMVIDNLIGNAVKLNAKNIDIIVDDSDKENYQVIIKDDGSGLDNTIYDVKTLFDFGVTTTGGSGLGLFYAKKYMEELNARIAILGNEDGVGASVKMSFKRH